MAIRRTSTKAKPRLFPLAFIVSPSSTRRQVSDEPRPGLLILPAWTQKPSQLRTLTPPPSSCWLPLAVFVLQSSCYSAGSHSSWSRRSAQGLVRQRVDACPPTLFSLAGIGVPSGFRIRRPVSCHSELITMLATTRILSDGGLRHCGGPHASKTVR